MAPKRAKFYTYGKDSVCVETKQFIEDSGVLLEVRDIENQPLTANELDHMFGHINIRHFLNTLSESYSKYRMDQSLPPREKIIELMAEDHTLIKRPIITTLRLLTVGCDKRKIAEMLQINANGNEPKDDAGAGNRRNRNNHAHAGAGK